MVIGSANTDEEAVPGSDQVDLTRSENRHLAFGGGVHRCLGSHLARLELRIALREWHRRIPEYSIVPGSELNYMMGLRQIDLPLPLASSGVAAGAERALRPHRRPGAVPRDHGRSSWRTPVRWTRSAGSPRRSPTGSTADWWRRGAELGWVSMLVAEDHGGGCISGGGLADLALVAEETGRRVSPGPLIPTNVVAAALSRSGSPDQHKQLAGLVAGDTIAAWCVGGDSLGWSRPEGGIRAEARRRRVRAGRHVGTGGGRGPGRPVAGHGAGRTGGRCRW